METQVAPSTPQTIETKVDPVETKVTETPKTPEWTPQKFKVKVNSKEIEREYKTQDEMVKDIQKGLAADEKMMTATAKERRAQEFIEKLMKDPKSLLRAKELGLSREQIRKLGEELVAEELEEELMDPKDKKIRDLETERQTWKADQERKAKEKADQEFLETKKKYADDYTKQIMEVVDKSTLPKTPYMVSRVARLMAASLNTEKPLTAMDAVPLVKEDYKADIAHFLKDLSPTQITEFLGEDIGKKIRQYDLDKLKSPLQDLKKPEVQAVSDEPREKKKEKRITATEWRKKFS